MAPVPVKVSVPEASSVQVTLLPSPSAPQVPLAGSTAKAAGTSAKMCIRDRVSSMAVRAQRPQV